MSLEYPTNLIVLKDITLFFHIQSDYSRLEEDIEWDMFNLPYWQYLEPDASTESDLFIQRSCLTIIITGAAAHGGNICTAFGDKIIECHAKVKSFRYSDSITERLRIQASEMLNIALTCDAERNFVAIQKFDRKSIYDQVIGQYFLRRCP